MKKILIALVLLFNFPIFASDNQSEKELYFSTSYKKTPEFCTTYISLDTSHKNNIRIFLSDGSSWKINPEILELLNEWKPADEIRIKSESKKQKTYLLKNLRTNQCIIAKIAQPRRSSTYHIIEAIDKNGYLLQTDKNTHWSIGYWGAFTTAYWEKKDRLVINKSYHSTWHDYLIINIDRKEHVWARLISFK